jgi:hypothetical protein
MCQQGRRLDPFKSVLRERQRSENRDASAIGCTAEHTSCTKPGRVSASDRHPPPIASYGSKTVTDRPACAIAIAADSPFGPEPMTMASGGDMQLSAVSYQIVHLGTGLE